MRWSGRRPDWLEDSTAEIGVCEHAVRGWVLARVAESDGSAFAELVVVVAVLGGLSALKQPVDLVGGRVPPLAQPVLETR